MFKGIKLKTFLSTPEEWHAFVIGFFEVLCPWPSRYQIRLPDNASIPLCEGNTDFQEFPRRDYVS